VLALALALVVPTVAGAYNKKDRKSEAKQNAAVKKVQKNLKAATKSLNVVKTTVSDQGKTLTALDTSVKGIDGRLKLIEGAAPQIITGLQNLKTLATSTEYGIGQLIVLEPTANPQEGSFVETPDIPDAVQQAQTTQQFVAQNTGALAVAYGVRSAESDGTGASNPAALCKVTVTNEGGTTETTAANPNIGGLPFQPVNTKSSLTSTDPLNAGFPFGLKTNGADADSTTTFVSSVTVTAGDTYTVGLSCVDTSPDANDPSA
jgi:hypothetical protein